MRSRPRYAVGEQVIVAPEGLEFGGTRYPGVITEIPGRWQDPRVGAPKGLFAYAYHVDIRFEHETTHGLVFEYEIKQLLYPV